MGQSQPEDERDDRKVVIQARVDPDLFAWVRREAEREHRSISNWVAKALEDRRSCA